MGRALIPLLLLLLAGLGVGLTLAGAQEPKLVLAAAGGLGYAYLVLRHRRAALAVLVASFPFFGMQLLALPAVKLSVLDATQLLFAGGATLVFLFGRPRLRVVRPLLPFLLFLGVCALSLLVTRNLTNSLFYLLRFALILYVFFLICNLITSIDDIRLLFQAYVTGMLALFLLNVNEILTYNYFGGYRIEIGTGNPNALGDILGFFLIILLHFLVSSTHGFKRLGYLALLASSGVFFLFTYSRGGWLAFGVAVLAWMYLNQFSLKWISLLASALILVLVFDDTLLGILTHRSFFVDQSSQNRLATYEYGLRAVFEHPVLGIGFDQFDSLYRYMWLPEEAYKRSPHNLYLKVGAEVGIPGLVLLLFGMARAMLSLFRAIPRWAAGEQEALLLRTAAALTVQQAVSQLSKAGLTSATFWLGLALATAIPVLLEQRGSPPPGGAQPAEPGSGPGPARLTAALHGGAPRPRMNGAGFRAL